ncbi:hypothetical protein GGF32_008697, partial [Allomyces javanicus]
ASKDVFATNRHADMPAASLDDAAVAARMPVNSMSQEEFRVFDRHFGTPDALLTYLDVRNRILQAFY